MSKETIIFEKLCEFINKHDIECVESVYQVDSINLECVDLVASIVEIVLQE